MRRLMVLGLLLAAAPLATAAAAEARQSVSAAPNPVRFGHTLTIRGKGWPVIEFCSRTVRLSLRSDQNVFRVGSVRTRTNGRFRFEWVPRRSQVGAGRWRLVARMRCESGEDGSPVIMRASTSVRIR
ncbi:MAG TPA: hypothetical protein VGF25_17270 [Thermoleophilaceae bacterium]|jgi:hypothetical protein